MLLQDRSCVRAPSAIKAHIFRFTASDGDATQVLPVSFSLQTSIITEGFRSLAEGEPVEFYVESGDDGRTKAVQVTGPAGAPPQVGVVYCQFIPVLWVWLHACAPFWSFELSFRPASFGSLVCGFQHIMGFNISSTSKLFQAG